MGSVSFSGSVTFSGAETFSGFVSFSGGVVDVLFSSGFPAEAEEEQTCKLEMKNSPSGQTLQACSSKSKR